MYSFIQLGNQPEKDGLYNKPIEWSEPIYADKKSISQSEFYQAGGAGIKAEIKFIIYNFEYDNQTHVKADNVQYRVLRTYQVQDSDKLELTCVRA